ncbi:hypothetical protein [Rhodococcus sp. ACS1]|uniref:hypothetical protein n=1 Tax=Rhodococcus sp. ACS1 TaxID=2028570 RepID=UPI001C528E39|nr:hypothetical protein [Rhodococcus sp. ACS1]
MEQETMGFRRVWFGAEFIGTLMRNETGYLCQPVANVETRAFATIGDSVWNLRETAAAEKARGKRVYGSTSTGSTVDPIAAALEAIEKAARKAGAAERQALARRKTAENAVTRLGKRATAAEKAAAACEKTDTEARRDALAVATVEYKKAEADAQIATAVAVEFETRAEGMAARLVAVIRENATAGLTADMVAAAVERGRAPRVYVKRSKSADTAPVETSTALVRQ